VIYYSVFNARSSDNAFLKYVTKVSYFRTKCGQILNSSS